MNLSPVSKRLSLLQIRTILGQTGTNKSDEDTDIFRDQIYALADVVVTIIDAAATDTSIRDDASGTSRPAKSELLWLDVEPDDADLYDVGIESAQLPPAYDGSLL